jgi:hypothetical protein
MIGAQENDTQCSSHDKTSFVEISPGEIVFNKHHLLMIVPMIENICQPE